jgi:hypothetical protein
MPKLIEDPFSMSSGNRSGAARPLFALVAALVLVLLVAACSSEEEASVTREGDDPSWDELVARLKNAEYQVTYDSTDATGSHGQLTVAVKGEKTYVAFDFEGDQLFWGWCARWTGPVHGY